VRRSLPALAIACSSLLVPCSLLRASPAQAQAQAQVQAQGQAQAQSAEPSRGRLLYETHCIGCHNSQMHWRDQRLARDWPGLLAQVRGWQARANLGWSDGDITEVARHLNDAIYRFPRPLAQAVRPTRAGA
jgi:hypothetical protein